MKLINQITVQGNTNAKVEKKKQKTCVIQRKNVKNHYNCYKSCIRT